MHDLLCFSHSDDFVDSKLISQRTDTIGIRCCCSFCVPVVMMIYLFALLNRMNEHVLRSYADDVISVWSSCDLYDDDDERKYEKLCLFAQIAMTRENAHNLLVFQTFMQTLRCSATIVLVDVINCFLFVEHKITHLLCWYTLCMCFMYKYEHVLPLNIKRTLNHSHQVHKNTFSW